MSRAALERFEAKIAKEREEARQVREDKARKRELKAEVKKAIPKKAMQAIVISRRRGRTPPGGIGRKEVNRLRGEATDHLDTGIEGLRALEREVRRTTLVMLKIDGLLGTEPWRADGPHAGALAFNARARYMENAIRILEDIRRSLGQDKTASDKLTDGVIPDGAADVVDGEVVSVEIEDRSTDAQAGEQSDSNAAPSS